MMRMANYHEDNNSFMIYKDWEAYFKSLDDMEEAGELIMALFAFAKRGELAEFTGALKMAFAFMSDQLERDGIKWENKCTKNAENGKKGGRPRKPMVNEETERFSEKTEKTERFSEKPKKPDTDTDTDTDTETDTVKDIKQAKPVKKSVSSEFERIWKEYPRKEGHKEAMAAFEKAIKKGTTIEQIESGIQAYCEHIKKCNIERQYIKQGSTYFRGEHWNDVYDDSETATAEQKKKSSYDLSKVIPAI